MLVITFLWLLWCCFLLSHDSEPAWTIWGPWNCSSWVEFSLHSLKTAKKCRHWKSLLYVSILQNSLETPMSSDNQVTIQLHVCLTSAGSYQSMPFTILTRNIPSLGNVVAESARWHVTLKSSIGVHLGWDLVATEGKHIIHVHSASSSSCPVCKHQYFFF